MKAYDRIISKSEKLAMVGQYVEDHGYVVEDSPIEGYIKVTYEDYVVAMIGDKTGSEVLVLGDGARTFNIANPKSLQQIIKHISKLKRKL